MGNGREICLVQGKVIFQTRDEARAARNALAARGGEAKAYLCPFGEHWHITKGARARKRRK